MEPSSGHNKLAKAKVRIVKPILKKRANSEKNSLDLDRPWEEQQAPGLGIGGITSYDSIGFSRSARDVSFSFAESPVLSGVKPHFHTRSPSGASHTSVTTTASTGGPRSGVFVHPFQQTPQTQTPPLSYANSVASLETSGAVFSHTATSSTRDYSPTITENEDDDDYPVGSLPTQRFHHSHTAPVSQSSSRHASLINQRTASFSDINAPAPLPRPSTSSRPIPNSRRGRRTSSLSSSLSHSDLHLHTSGVSASATFDSPISPGSSMSMPRPSASSWTTFSSPTAAATATAGPHDIPGFGSTSAIPCPARGSLEGVGLPRLRSRSELDAGARAEQIREARRKFEERERAKEEKHDREMLRKRERQAAAQHRKNSGTGSDVVRPSLSRKSTHTFGSGSGSGDGSGSGNIGNAGDSEIGNNSGVRHGRQAPEIPEKPLAFKSSKYDSVAGGTTPSFGPDVNNVAFKNAQRNNSTKRKTQGYWTGFVLWLRTRLFRMGRK